MNEFYVSIEGALQCFLEAVAVWLVKWSCKMLTQIKGRLKLDIGARGTLSFQRAVSSNDP